MQFIKRHRKIIVLAAIIVTAGIVFAVFLTELCRLPFKKVRYTEDARAAFTQCYDAIDEILEPYGLTTQPYRVEYVEEKRDHPLVSQYLLSAEIPLNDGCCMQIELASNEGRLPDYRLYFKSGWHSEAEDCYLNLEDYPYVFDIASYLFGQQYSSKRLQNISLNLQNTAQEKIRKEGIQYGDLEEKELKGLFIALGSLNYVIGEVEDTDQETYQAYLYFFNYLYLK